MGKIWIVVVVVLVLLGLAYWIAKSNQSSNTTNNTTDNMSTSNDSTSTPVATNSVTISNMAFSPSAITVKVGDTITWTNNDSVAHNVTESDTQTGPKSDTLQPGQSYTFTYTTAGTFPYQCTIHPTMTGTVTVTQ